MTETPHLLRSSSVRILHCLHLDGILITPPTACCHCRSPTDVYCPRSFTCWWYGAVVTVRQRHSLLSCQRVITTRPPLGKAASCHSWRLSHALGRTPSLPPSALPTDWQRPSSHPNLLWLSRLVNLIDVHWIKAFPLKPLTMHLCRWPSLILVLFPSSPSHTPPWSPAAPQTADALCYSLITRGN